MTDKGKNSIISRWIDYEKGGTAMAFDAGMLACIIDEISRESMGARVEKVYQPDRDEIHIQIRSLHGGRRILINAGSNNPRMGFTEIAKENPQNPPMFCVLLRKHLSGSKLSEIEMLGFERAVLLGFDTRDEMGFETKCYLVAELMGKYSNLIFLDKDKRVVSALKIIDFTTSSVRQILPGMTYELPPKQDKKDPLSETREGFFEALDNALSDNKSDKFILSNYAGISASVAREIAYRASKKVDSTLRECVGAELWLAFEEIIDQIKSKEFTPSAVFENEKPIEYAFCTLTHYGDLEVKSYESPSAMIDTYFETRDRETRVRQKASDILKILTNAETRLIKKIGKQESELADCEKGEEYKKQGDLITANIYAIERGMKRVQLVDYSLYDEESGEYASVEIELDTRLSPAANAQRMYKRYNKSKSAKRELTLQIEKARGELDYIYSVFDALSHAENTSDLVEIRDELYTSGYASRMKNYKAQKKKNNSGYMKFRTTDGYLVLCGKNNIQNEFITFNLAKKSDYWFHAKNMPGSHVIMVCEGDEPDAVNFTDACEIAAFYSKAEGAAGTEVDYTFAKNVKKIPSGKPGLVLYHTNWSTVVSPSAEKIAKMREA